MLLVEAISERFVLLCDTAETARGGMLDANRGVAWRAFVADWSKAAGSANFGWAAEAFKTRKQKAESRKPDGQKLKR
jgi:hypothetical protein